MFRRVGWYLLGGVLATFAFPVRPWVLRRIRKRGAVVVIAAHNPEKRVLEKTLRWFEKRGFAFIGADDVVAYLDNRKEFRRPAVWLTFDDGWKGNVELFPWLEQHRIPATVFLATNSMETGYFWCDVVGQSCNAVHRRVGRFDYEKQPNSVRRTLVRELVANPGTYVPRNAMSVSDVRTWARRGVSFENHTADHVILSQCTPAEARNEILLAGNHIQAWTEREARIFCYPKGQSGSADAHLLAGCGIRAAVTATGRVWIPAGNPDAEHRYFIPRTHLYNSGPSGFAVASALGITTPVLALLRRARTWLYCRLKR